jgi:hypothetical protein
MAAIPQNSAAIAQMVQNDNKRAKEISTTGQVRSEDMEKGGDLTKAVANDTLIKKYEAIGASDALRNGLRGFVLADDALVGGAKSGRLNKDEFVDLNDYRNETLRMQEEYRGGGFNRNENGMLLKREEEFQRRYNRYMHGDYHPEVHAGGLTGDGKGSRDAAIDRRLQSQSGQIYDGLRKGSVTDYEGAGLLKEQRDISKLRGRLDQGRINDSLGTSGRGTGLDEAEKRLLHSRLDASAGNIRAAKSNNATDSNPLGIDPKAKFEALEAAGIVRDEKLGYMDGDDALIKGVKNGDLNKDEFKSLMDFRNETLRMQAEYQKSGISEEEAAMLKSREEEFQRRYDGFVKGDLHPEVIAGGLTGDGKGLRDAEIDRRMQEQADRMYDGMRNGSISYHEAKILMGEQKEASWVRGIFDRGDQSGALGTYGKGTGLDSTEKSILNSMLDRSSRDIWGARNNLVSDSNPYGIDYGMMRWLQMQVMMQYIMQMMMGGLFPIFAM